MHLRKHFNPRYLLLSQSPFPLLDAFHADARFCSNALCPSHLQFANCEHRVGRWDGWHHFWLLPCKFTMSVDFTYTYHTHFRNAIRSYAERASEPSDAADAKEALSARTSSRVVRSHQRRSPRAHHIRRPSPPTSHSASSAVSPQMSPRVSYADEQATTSGNSSSSIAVASGVAQLPRTKLNGLPGGSGFLCILNAVCL